MKLNKNEKRILKFLIENGRVQDAEIARKLNITPQGVGKIRRKLESEDVIKGYSSIVDYEKLGIKVLAIALFKFTPESRRLPGGEDIDDRIKGAHIINFYRVPEGDVTHVVTYGFRSLEELDHYFHILQTERGHISEIKKLFILSAKSLKKSSDKELLTKAINEMGHETLARPLPPRHEVPRPPSLKRRILTDIE